MILCSDLFCCIAGFVSAHVARLVCLRTVLNDAIETLMGDTLVSLRRYRTMHRN